MPDAKRKLPVLYVPTIDGEPDFDTQTLDDGQTESLVVVFASDKYLDRYNKERNEAGYTSVEMAEYEPAVPRCRTCPRFSVLGQDARCQHEPSRHVPVNGSGYCHEHPEAQRD